MTIHLATDHAGFALKNTIKELLEDRGFEVVDHGAYELDPADDYPDFIRRAAEVVSASPQNNRAIIFGGSGQAEAMVANRFPNVRAAVYYGDAGTQTDAAGNDLDIVTSTRRHNDANILSIGARFVTEETAKEAVLNFLEVEFEGGRHENRIAKIELRDDD